MFNLFKSKSNKSGQLNDSADQAEICLQINGMHCVSCGMNIDNELEEIGGVLQAETNYANSQTKVKYNPMLVSVNKIKDAISKLGYQPL